MMKWARTTILALSLLAAGATSLAASKKVTVPLVDGMTITLGHTYQTIKVRAQSMGPGACGVKFYIDRRVYGHFLAPPHVWSTWVAIGPAMYSTVIKLGFDAVCDTGAIAQVRYSK